MEAYKMKSYEVNCEFVYGIEDVSMVSMFKSLEATRLPTSLSVPVIY